MCVYLCYLPISLNSKQRENVPICPLVRVYPNTPISLSSGQGYEKINFFSTLRATLTTQLFCVALLLPTNSFHSGDPTLIETISSSFR